MTSGRRDQLTEVSMGKGFGGCDAFPVVIAQKLVKQVQSFMRDVRPVLLGDKPWPDNLGVAEMTGDEMLARHDK